MRTPFRLVTAILCSASAAAFAADPKSADDPDRVIGKSGGAHGHRWEWQGEPSPRAPIGKPDGRLQVKVRNGDVLRFTVEGGSHGVLFERAQAELDAGVWEVVEDSGELKELPAAGGFDRFDRGLARTTAPEGAGQTLIDIRIKDLRPGPENGVLFACNPHSALGDPDDAMMVGVIVLAEDEKAERDGSTPGKGE